MSYVGNVDLAFPNIEDFFSGAKYYIYLNRDTGFYIKYYIGPAIIFVLLSYTSFFISRAAAMARVVLCTISILLTVQFRNNISLILP